ncbi:MAG: hypothetical protein ACI4IF_08225 [Acutalibacteraceae bacterium]
MYDFNLTVPNLTSQKYSNENKFLLLKNYLYELNDVLSMALSEKEESITQLVNRKTNDATDESKAQIIQLKSDSLKKFQDLKNEILRVSGEIEMNYETAIEQSKTEIIQSARGEFLSQTEFGEYKNDVETAISETADRVTVNAQTNEEIKSDLENFKKTSNSQLTVQAEDIMSQVENIYAVKTDVEELEERIGSAVTQTTENITENFYNSLETLNEDLSTLGGKVTELVSDLNVYIRRGELEDGIYGIEIGRSDSNIKARFTNDRLSFYQGITEVAYISGNNLYITRAEILDFLKIGNTADGFFTFDITSNGLEVRWSDGS